MLAVQILMQAVIVVRGVPQQKRCRLDLPGRVAAGKVVDVLVRIGIVDAHRIIPPVGDGRETRVKGPTQIGDDVGQRIAEIFVFAAPEAVSRHHHTAAKQRIDRIQ